jgi:hypothetical protein
MKFWPQWTRRVVTEETGRDPLGLSLVSDALTEFLLPGIITTTDRARYYSFYTWAIADVAAARKNAGLRFSFEAEFQRREAAFALASRIGAKTDLSVVGFLKVREKLAEAEEDQIAYTAFRVLPSNALGGLGNYYGGCLRGMGLAGFDEDGEWMVAEGRGLALADSFASATRKAPYLAGDYRHRERVPLDVLQKSANLFALDGLRSSSASVERGLLTELFFCLGQKPDPLAPLNRQATLGQLLHVLQSYNDAGLELTRRNIDWAGVFWPHYYGCIAEPDGRPRRYESPPAFATVHGFWRQFCAHQFFAFALEELLAAVLDALVPYPDGLTEADLLDALVNEDFLDDITQTLGRKCPRPRALLSALSVNGVPDSTVSRAVARQFGAAASLNDWAVCYNRDVGPQTRLGRAVILLALLYGKWRGQSGDAAFDEVAVKAAKDLWLGTMFPWIDSWIGERLSWRTAVERLLNWMLRRHDLVKFRKRNLEASWFEVADGRWLKQQDIVPSFRASRHRNAVTILQDLAFIEHSKLDEPLVLTNESRRVLLQVTRLRT